MSWLAVLNINPIPHIYGFYEVIFFQILKVAFTSLSANVTPLFINKQFCLLPL